MLKETLKVTKYELAVEIETHIFNKKALNDVKDKCLTKETMYNRLKED
jgi:hypothetical protein